VTKQEFVEDLAERTELSKADAGRAVNAILDSLTEVMADGEEVSFTGFGKFLSQRRRGREGVNPQDPSKKIKIRAANVPKFRPGTTLREAVAQSSGGARPSASADRGHSDDTGNGAGAAASGGGQAAAATSSAEPSSSGQSSGGASSGGQGSGGQSSGEPEWRPLGDRG
jgi:DNA-binding protein HU-beta